MKKNYKKRLVIYIILAGFVHILCNPAWTQVKHIRPHSIQPAPRPPQQILQEARFYKWDSKEVIKKFKEAGLEVVEVKGLVVGAPAAKESTIFLIPSFGEDIGGLVSSFSSEEDLKKTLIYYSRMNKDSISPVWWIFVKDNVLVLISGMVPEEKAREYKEILNNMN
jgi:hypothetical protein